MSNIEDEFSSDRLVLRTYLKTVKSLVLVLFIVLGAVRVFRNGKCVVQGKNESNLVRYFDEHTFFQYFGLFSS